MATIVEQELAIRVAIPTTIPPITGVTPHIMPAEGTSLEKDSSLNTLTYRVVANPKGLIPYVNGNLAAVPSVGLIWFDYGPGWLKFRKKSEDNDPFVYVISLSDPIPE